VPLFSNEKIEEFIYHKSMLSTNVYAIQQVDKHESDTNVVYYTYNQSEGRGQRGKSWYTGKGENLALSVSLPLKGCYVSWGSYLNLWAANCIRSFIQSKLPDQNVLVKWPNDIYVEDKKICGLLIQSIVQSKFIKQIVIGIGINVNSVAFPEDLPNPTSLRIESKSEHNLYEFLQDLIDHIEEQIGQFSFSGFDDILSLYHEHLYLKDQKHRFTNNKTQEKFDAYVRHVDKSGAIQLETSGGMLAFKFREITY